MKSLSLLKNPLPYRSKLNSQSNYKFRALNNGLFLILFVMVASSSFAGTITTGGSGNWSSTTPNAPWPGGVIPSGTDDIVIGNGFTLTVDISKTCNSVSFTAPASGTGTGTLIVNSGVALTVVTAVSAPASTAAIKTAGTYNVSGSGQINCGTVNVGNSLSPTGSALSIIALISTINNLTIAGNINIYSAYSNAAGGKSNNGKLNIQTGTVIVNGTINTTNSNSNNTSTLDLVTSSNNPSLILNGANPFNLSATGTNNISLNGTGATITYNYAGSQNVYNTSYTNLNLSGSGTKTMPAAALSISGNLSLSGTASATAAGALTIGGNATIESGSTFNASSFTHNVSGNWVNSGTFAAATSTINLNGASQQTISGSSTTTFNNLTLNNTSGAVISTSPIVKGTLIFTNGKITTGVNKVTLSSTATTSGTGVGKYIYGNEEIFIPNSTAPGRTFDIGDNTNYTPVNIAFSGTTSGSGSLTASTYSGDNVDIVNSGIDSFLSVNRNWTLSNTGVSGFTSYAATLNYVSADKDPLTNPSNFIVRLLSGSVWMPTTISSANMLSTQVSGLTTFGTFQIGTLGAAPTVVTNPTDFAVCSTNGATFTATATASPAAGVKWQRDANTGSFTDITAVTDGGVYTDYNSATLNITNTAGLANYKYRAIFSNMFGMAPSASATLSVTTAPTPTFSYGGTTFCNTGSVSVDLTGGTTGGTFSSSTGLNINSTTGLIDLANSTAGDYVVNYALPATGACPVIQNNFNLTVNQAGLWTGAVSTTWNLAANWQCGVVPTKTTNVTIPSGLFNYPTITVGVTAAVNNISLQTDASITISYGSLQIAGTATTEGGKISAISGKVEFNGSATQVIPGHLFNSNIIKDLVVTNPAGVSLNAPVRVTNTVGFGNVNNSVLSSNGFLTLVSTSSNTANVTDITNGGLNKGNKIDGNVTVERYSQGRRAFRFLTAPVNSTTSIRTNWMENTNNPSTSVNNNPVPGYGTHITGPGGNANAFDATNTNNSSFYTYNNLTQTWTTVPNTSGLFAAGNAFRILVRGSRSVDLNNNGATPSATTLRATGTLVSGPVVFAATGGTTGVPALSNVVGSYNFIGNPYASTVNWESILLTATDISPTMYIFDPTITGSNGRGGYVSYNALLKVNNVVSSLINKNIQSGQAFFVQTTGTNPSVTFNETNKLNSFLPVFRTADQVPHLAIELLLADQVGTQTAADGVAVYFSDDYSSSICRDDSYKFTNLDENIAIVRDGTSLSIEGRKSITSNDSVPLKIWQLSKNSYVLKINMENFASNVQGFIQDKFLKTSAPLVAGENSIPYGITSDVASSASDRFTITFKTLSTLPVRITGLKAYVKNKGVEVDWVAENESNINTYEVERSTDAQQFVTIGSAQAKNNAAIAAEYNYFDAIPHTGDNYYRVKTIEKSGEIKLSEVIRVQLADAKNSIVVTNNPIEGNSVQLLFDNVATGVYMVNLLSASGEKVYSGKISYTGGSSLEKIELKNHLPVGIYQLQITNSNYNKTIPVMIK